jgi:glucuronosyltransferase
MTLYKIRNPHSGSTPAVFTTATALLVATAMATAMATTTTMATTTVDQKQTGAGTTYLGKVLLYPVTLGQNSHIVNFVRLGKILRNRGYQVHLLIGADAGSWDELNKTFDVIHRNPSAGKSDIDSMAVTLQWSAMSAYQFVVWLADKLLRQCEALLSRPNILTNIQRERYDLLIADFIDNCGRIVSEYLNIPTIAYSAAGFVGDVSLFPDMPSFIPASPMSRLEPGKMTFYHRIENAVEYAASVFLWYPYWFGSFQTLREKYHMNSSLDIRNSYLRALKMIRSDFVLDYPRPVMPNVVTIEGIFSEDPKPLPLSIETFVDGAGSDGVIVVCFGTLIGRLDEKRNELFARVLARFPQRVVWRVTGTRPASLGNNTLAVDWLPQNDLLGHASTRLFVSHCGLSSSMEAAYNAIPVVAMPICTDGFQNARKLSRAGMAVILEFQTLTEDSLEHAIWEVLNDPRYKRNASRVATLLDDTMVPPRDKFLYYVGYMIRHGGAVHWQADVLESMNKWQLHNYDIVTFALIFIILTLFTAGCMMLLCVKLTWRCWSTLKLESKEHSH